MYFELQRSGSRGLNDRRRLGMWNNSSFFSMCQRNPRIAVLTFFAFIVFGFFVYLQGGIGLGLPGSSNTRGELRNVPSQACRYPHQRVWTKYTESSNSYSFALISDMDKNSKMGEDKQWRSLLKKGTLLYDPDSGKFSVEWDSETELVSTLNEAGRAMELSDLTYFGQDLFAFDDRTGVVFKVKGSDLLPYRILLDGDGEITKGMKVEWATVKDDLLYVGSTGKEWTTPEGKFVNNNPLWVKTIDREGRVSPVNWYDVYTKLRQETGTLYPGYLLHEAVRWRASDRRWYFFPRRVSTLPYDEEKDEERGSNHVLSTDEDFNDVKVFRLGPHIPTHGFSAFQFLPWRDNVVVALKTEEFQGKISTYITVFDLTDGSILMPEESVGNVKFEGIEII